MREKVESTKYISLMEASQLCDYSQEYLSLRARQKKLKAVKLGRNWVTTKEWLNEYVIQVTGSQKKEVIIPIKPGRSVLGPTDVPEARTTSETLRKFWKKPITSKAIDTFSALIKVKGDKKAKRLLKQKIKIAKSDELAKIKAEISKKTHDAVVKTKQFCKDIVNKSLKIAKPIINKGLEKGLPWVEEQSISLFNVLKREFAIRTKIVPQGLLVSFKTDKHFVGFIIKGRMGRVFSGLAKILLIIRDISVKGYKRLIENLSMFNKYISIAFQPLETEGVLVKEEKIEWRRKDTYVGLIILLLVLISGGLVLGARGGLTYNNVKKIVEQTMAGVGESFYMVFQGEAPSRISEGAERLARNTVEFISDLPQAGGRLAHQAREIPLETKILAEKIGKSGLGSVSQAKVIISKGFYNLSDTLSDTAKEIPNTVNNMNSAIKGGLAYLSDIDNWRASFQKAKSVSIGVIGEMRGIEGGIKYNAAYLYSRINSGVQTLGSGVQESSRIIGSKGDGIIGDIGEIGKIWTGELAQFKSELTLIAKEPEIIGKSISLLIDSGGNLGSQSVARVKNIAQSIGKGIDKAEKHFISTYKIGFNELASAYRQGPENVADVWQKVEEVNQSVKNNFENGVYLAVSGINSGAQKGLVAVQVMSGKVVASVSRFTSISGEGLAIIKNNLQKASSFVSGLPSRIAQGLSSYGLTIKNGAKEFGGSLKDGFSLVGQRLVEKIGGMGEIWKTREETKEIGGSYLNFKKVTSIFSTGYNKLVDFWYESLFKPNIVEVPVIIKEKGATTVKEVSRVVQPTTEITKKTVSEVKQVEKIIEKTKEIIASADLEALRKKDEELLREIQRVGNELILLSGKFSAGISTASNAPLNIGSSGFNVEGHTNVYSLSVNTDLGVGRDLSVSGSTILGTDSTDLLTVRARSLFTHNADFSEGLDVTGNDLTVGGTNFVVDSSGNLTTTGSITITGTTTLSSALSVGGDLTVGGNTILGNATSSDLVTFNSRINSGIQPAYDNLYDLGDGDNWLRWRTGYFGTSVGIGGTATTTGDALTVSGAFTINPSLNLIASSTSGNLIFATNGLERARITSAGIMGIGTTTPTGLLNIASADPRLYITDTNAGANKKHWWLYSNAGDFQIGTTSDSLTTNATFLTIKGDTGNVGIGTADPSRKLEISDDSSFRLVRLTSNNSIGAVIEFNPTATGGVGWEIGSMADASATGGGAFAFTDSGGNVRMVLDSIYGRVGIGTTTPTSALHLAKDAGDMDIRFESDYFNWTMGIDNSDAGKFKIASSTALGTNDRFVIDSRGYIGIGTSTPRSVLNIAGAMPQITLTDTTAGTNEKHWFLSSIGGNLMVGTSTDALNSTSTYLTISRNGYVGIGTTSPSQKFSVNGDVYITGGLGVGVATTTPGVIQSSGSFYVGGNLTVSGNATVIGNTLSDTLTVNATINSNLIPNENATKDLGSTAYYWDDLYVDQVVANNISAASTTIGGTQSETFTINSNNATADTETQDLIFFRGTVVPNALITWDSTNDKFDFNQPVFMQNDSSTTTVVSLDVWGKAGQTADLLRIASSTGSSYLTVTGAGNIGISTSSPNNLLDIYSTTKAAIGFSGASDSTYKWTMGMDMANGGRFSIASSTALGSSDRFVIDGTGNVGIGTTGPANKLEILSATTPQQRISYDPSNYLTTSVSSTGGVIFAVNGSAGGMIITNPQPASTSDMGGTNAATALTVTGGIGGVSTHTGTSGGGNGGGLSLTSGTGGSASTGLIFSQGGIGGAIAITSGTGGAATASGATAMKIGGAGGSLTFTSGAGGVASNSGVTNTGGAGGAFYILGGAGAGASGSSIYNAGGNGGTIYISGGAGGTGATSNGTSGDVYLGYSGTSALGNVYLGNQSVAFIGASGNVGIGTTTPFNRLTIAGINQSNGDIGLTATSTTGNFNYYWTMGIDRSDAGKFKIASSTALGSTDRFVIDGAGNVGINTASPSYTLDVNGTLRATGNTFFDSNTTLGNATSSDIVYLNSRLANSLVPIADNFLDIGDATNWLRWRTGYFGTSVDIAGTATTTGNALTFSGAGNISMGAASILNVLSGTLSINTTNNQAVAFGTGNVNIPYASTTALTVSSFYPTNVYAFTLQGAITGNNQNITGLGTASTTNLYVSGNQYLSPMTSGSILFAGTGGLISQDNSNLYWDDFNNRLGIGSTSPYSKLSVWGAGTGATSLFELTNNASTTLLSILNNGNVNIPVSTATTTIGGGLSVAGSSGLTVLQNGNVGIGSVSPSNKLHVEGQCVTGDTLLPVIASEERSDERGNPVENSGIASSPLDELGAPRNDKMKLVQIKDIKGGEYVLSLDEKTGKLVPAKIKGLLDMGVKPVFRLTTEDGRTIRTTGNHPYLTKNGWTKVADLEEGEEIAAPKLLFVMAETSQKINSNSHQASGNVNNKKNSGDVFHINLGSKNKIKSDNENYTSNDVKNSLGFHNNYSANLMPVANKNSDINEPVTKAAVFTSPENPGTKNPITVAANTILPRSIASLDNSLTLIEDSIYFNNNNSETDVKWEKITSIEYVGYEQVYDIEVEGTHNFVANSIIAHNTYISGNVGIGTTSPYSRLSVWGAGTGATSLFELTNNASTTLLSILNNGNVNIPVSTATTTIGGGLSVAGSSGLTVLQSGNVGIGTTAPSTRLTVQGTNSETAAGSEMITAQADRDFSGAGNWTGTNWSISGGTWTHTAGANATSLANDYVDPDPVAGTTYLITFTSTYSVVGTLTPSFGGASCSAVGQDIYRSPLTAYACVVTAVNTNPLTFTPNATWVGTLDDISVKPFTPTSALATLNNADGSGGLEIRSGGASYNNIFLGIDTGKNSYHIAGNTGYYNAGLGYQALYNNTTGSYNLAMGYRALYANTAGANNVAMGYNTLYANTSGSQNVAIGMSALDALTDANNNIAIGGDALGTNTIGEQNVAIGRSALALNISGTANVAMGYFALYNNTSDSNVGIGQGALQTNTSGGTNTALGRDAGYYSQTGRYNVFVGSNAGKGAAAYTGADNNTIIGYQAGYSLATNADGNVFLGYQAGYNETGSNKLYIANTSGTSLIYGDFSTGALGLGGTAATSSPYLTIGSTGNVGIGTTSPYSKLSVWGADTGATSLFELTNNASTTLLSVLNNGNVNIPVSTATTTIGGGLSVAGSSGLTVLQSGNVGIGTASPGALLDVNGTARISGAVGGTGGFAVDGSGIVKMGTTYAGLRISASVGSTRKVELIGLDLGGGAYSNIYLRGGATPTLAITTDGNVGIGTTNPFAKLSVTGNTAQTNPLFVVDYSATGTATSSAMYITSTGNVGIGTTTPAGLLNIASTSPYLYLTDTNASANNKHWFLENNAGALSFGTTTDALAVSDTRAMTILNNGNVGIGTTSPSATLGVNGLMYIGGTGTSTIQNNLYVMGTLRATVSYVGDLIFSNGFRFIESDTTFPSQSLYLQGPGGENIFAISEDGNVGIGDIGTTTPYKLAVGGEVAAEGFVNISTREAKTDIQYLNEQDYDAALESILGAKVATYKYKSDNFCDVIARSGSDEAISGGSPRSSAIADSLAMTSEGCSRRLGLIAEEAPPEVLSADGKGVDLYKMTSLAWAGMKAQQNQIDKLKMSVEDLENKVREIGEIGLLGGSGSNEGGFGLASVLNGLRYLGTAIENGVAKFQKVVAKSLAIEKNSDSTQSAVGEAMIRAGNTVVIIPSKLVKANSQVFLTSKTPLKQSLAVTGIIEGESFKVELAEKESNDIYFNWWIVGVEEPTENPNDPSSVKTSEGEQTPMTNDQAQQEQPQEVAPVAEQQTEISSEPMISPAPEPEPAPAPVEEPAEQPAEQPAEEN